MELSSAEKRILRYIGFDGYNPRTAENKQIVRKLMRKKLVFNPATSFREGNDEYRLTSDGIMAWCGLRP